MPQLEITLVAQGLIAMEISITLQLSADDADRLIKLYKKKKDLRACIMTE
jgi:hypothetical protein